MYLPRYLALYHKKWHYANNYVIFFGKFTKVYVAVVSDNDGSAFITKAEFDSLKNNFQAQIDNYNQSIDSKIDGAIASYLAGIKVNTDDTPEFRVFGADGGIWNSKKCNKMYLQIQGTAGAWAKDDVASNWCIALESATKSDKGFGFAWWYFGFAGVPGQYNLGVDEKYIGWLACGIQSNGLPSGGDDRFRYRTDRNSGTGYNSIGTLMMTGKNIQYLCSRGLSISFQQCISLWKPEFTFFEFLDRGSVDLSFAKVINGHNYEGGTNGGRSGNGALNGGTAKLKLSRGGVDITTWDVNGFSDLTWVQKSVDVMAGDKIVFTAEPDTDGGGTGKYSIFFFGNQIPGWKNADEP